MPKPARLNAHQSCPPQDHRRDCSSTQAALNSPTRHQLPRRPRSTTAPRPLSPPPLATAHRPPEAHTSERQRLRWRSGERLHNRRRPTTAKQPWSPRMPMPARLNAYQSRPPHDHRRDSSSTQAPNSPTHHQLPRRPRSTTAPPPLSPPPLATGRKAGGTLGWSTSQSPNANASAHKKTAVRREGRVSLLLRPTSTRRSQPAHTSSVRTVRGASTEARSSMLI